MKFLLKTNEYGQVVEYIPEANLDSIPDDGILKTEAEVEEMMSIGIVWVIDNAITYPPKKGQHYIDDKWSFPADYDDKLKENLKSQLIFICDSKQADIMGLILGHKNTPAQLQRYERNYKRAKEGQFNSDENTAVIAAHEGFLVTIDRYVDLIEIGRKAITLVIENSEYEKAKQLMDSVSLLGKNTTLEELQELLVATT